MSDQPDPQPTADAPAERGLAHDVILVTADAIATGAAAYVGAKLGSDSGTPPSNPEPPAPGVILPPGVDRPE